MTVDTVAEIRREHRITQTQYYQWRDRFLDGGKRALTNGLLATEETLTREIAKLQQLIGKQAVAIELLKDRRPGREAVRLVETLRAARCSIAEACGLIGLSCSRHYAARHEGGVRSLRCGAARADLADLRGASLLWGYRRVWAWLRYREGVRVNKKRVPNNRH